MLFSTPGAQQHGHAQQPPPKSQHLPALIDGEQAPKAIATPLGNLDPKSWMPRQRHDGGSKDRLTSIRLPMAPRPSPRSGIGARESRWRFLVMSGHSAGSRCQVLGARHGGCLRRVPVYHSYAQQNCRRFIFSFVEKHSALGMSTEIESLAEAIGLWLVIPLTIQTSKISKTYPMREAGLDANPGGSKAASRSSRKSPDSFTDHEPI